MPRPTFARYVDFFLKLLNDDCGKVRNLKTTLCEPLNETPDPDPSILLYLPKYPRPKEQNRSDKQLMASKQKLFDFSISPRKRRRANFGVSLLTFTISSNYNHCNIRIPFCSTPERPLHLALAQTVQQLFPLDHLVALSAFPLIYKGEGIVNESRRKNEELLVEMMMSILVF